MILERDRLPKPPYVHQDHPRVMYRGEAEHKHVQNPEEEKAAIAAGFARTPPVPVDPDAGPDAPAPAKPAKPAAPKPAAK